MIDIQAGDVVVCVDDGPDQPNGWSRCERIKAGKLYRIERLWVARNAWQEAVVAKLRGVPSETISGGYGLYRFRKLDKATDKFTTQIKAIRPIKQREDA